MIKKYIFVALLLLLLPKNNVLAQTLTASNTCPSVGDKFYYYVDTYVTPGNSGQSQLWDFSNVGYPSYYTEVLNWLGVPPTTNAFQSSNLSRSIESNGYFIYTCSNGGWTYDGDHYYSQQNSINSLFSPKQTILPFPCSYGTSVTTSWTTPSAVIGKNEIVCDATGTLVLCTESYTDCVRIHAHNTFTNGSNFQDEDVYQWYSPSKNALLFETRFATITNNGSPSTVSSARFLNTKIIIPPPNPNGLSELHLGVTPNMRIFISQEENLIGDFSESGVLSVFDLTGALLFSKNTDKNSVIAFEYLRGVYTAELYTESGYRKRIKFIKQ